MGSPTFCCAIVVVSIAPDSKNRSAMLGRVSECQASKIIDMSGFCPSPTTFASHAQLKGLSREAEMRLGIHWTMQTPFLGSKANVSIAYSGPCAHGAFSFDSLALYLRGSVSRDVHIVISS